MNNLGIDFKSLNGTIFEGQSPDKLTIGKSAVDYTTPRGVISALLPYIFTMAGLILFVMLVWGGFEMLLGASDPKQQQAGQQRLTAALVGFILIFAAYWIAQLVEKIFGVSIVGTFGKGP